MSTEAACVNHPDITRHVNACRECKAPVCQDCRRTHYIGGGGIPTLICLDCARQLDRRAALRRGTGVLGILVLIAGAVAVFLSPLAMILPLAISALWIVYLWRKMSSGMGSPLDGLTSIFLFRRFLP
jgi:hypothetical protein